jgi:ribosomal protein S6--L-glutamate ligase
MHIGILSARDQNYHPNKRINEAATALGHRTSLIHPVECLLEIGYGNGGLKIPTGVDRPDVILPRLGATIKDFSMTIVHHAEHMGVPVINGFQSILLARNKSLSMQKLAAKGIAVPLSYHAVSLENFEHAVIKLGGYPVVVKTLSSRQGTGVVLVESAIVAAFICHHLIADKGQGLLIQEFIEPRKRRDIRVFTLGRQIVAAMELEPKEGDFRSNIHLKARPRAIELHQEHAGLAIEAARALGLEIAGVDIMVDAKGTARVIEVNYSPGFRGLEASTGLDIASAIVRYVTQNREEDPWK